MANENRISQWKNFKIKIHGDKSKGSRLNAAWQFLCLHGKAQGVVTEAQTVVRVPAPISDQALLAV